MPVIDTSWLIALFNEADAHHANAKAHRDAAEPFLLPGVVLAEYLRHIVFVERGKVGTAAARTAARDFFKRIRTDPAFETEPSYPVTRSAEIYERNIPLSYVDAVGVAVALTTGKSLLTFDDNQATALEREKKLAS